MKRKNEVITGRGTHVMTQPRDGSTKKVYTTEHGICTLKYGMLYGPKGNKLELKR